MLVDKRLQACNHGLLIAEMFAYAAGAADAFAEGAAYQLRRFEPADYVDGDYVVVTHRL